jgi:hypothetical protein
VSDGRDGLDRAAGVGYGGARPAANAWRPEEVAMTTKQRTSPRPASARPR